MNDHDEAALFSDFFDYYSPQRHINSKGRMPFLPEAENEFNVTVTKNRSGVNLNEYLYSSGEHRPYGRIEPNN